MTREISPSAMVAGRLFPLLAALAISVAWTGSPAGAQVRDLSRVRTLAVAPFADDDPTTRPLADRGAARLSDLLARGGPFQIIDSARVAAEMRRVGLTAPSLISPAQTILLGARLSVDAVLTGRIVQIIQDSATDPPGEGGSSIEGRAAIDVRVLEVGSRLIVLQEEFRCTVPGLAAEAVECVVRDVAARLRQRRN